MLPVETIAEQVTQGAVLEGPYWPEPVRVLTAQVDGDYVELHVIGLDTERHYDSVEALRDIQAHVHIQARQDTPTFTANPLHFRLAVEAMRIGLAYEYDPHFAISVSQIAPLPHQLEAVYDYILPRPRLRFMLADDPGAGKTIMAGLALKELKYRGVVARTLIVVPANLTPQWQREMDERFGETFVTMDRALLRALPGRNAWEHYPQCITSVDFAKQDDVMDTLRDVRWDLVIVDEAHKMAAYRYGKKTTKTDRYQLGELLSDQSDGLLFLTATPHKGDPNNFLLLLQLLDPDLYADTDILRQAVQRDENPIFLRRMKEQMRGFDGRPLFPDRHPITVGYTLSRPERRLYEAVTDYVEDGFQRAFGEENRHVQLALIVLQRRLASSLRAIRRSLEKRRDRLQALYAHGMEALRLGDANELDWEALEDMPELERWRMEDEAVARHTMARDLPALEAEVAELQNLIQLAEIAEASGEERKLQELRRVMEDEGLFHSDEKLLIFTEAKDTLDYLVENLERLGFRTTQIHGLMPLGEREDPAPGTRLYAERTFADPDGAQIMVATEAAGEGINLQFCHLMVNYDIPWNPNRLAQRMGRIHRYGQEKEVYIFNLVATDTREGEVVARLLEKLAVMRDELGSDAVFDVIDEVAQGKSLEQLFRQALARRRTFDEILADIDAQYDPANAELVRKARLEGLATDRIDFSGVLQREQASEEHRLMPAYIERFFVEAFRALDEGVLEAKGDGVWGIDWLRSTLRDVPEALTRRFGALQQRYRRFTFRKPSAGARARAGADGATFVAPGHPLFEAVRYQTAQHFTPALREGAVFYDPQGREGRLWLLRGSVRDGHGDTVGQRLFAVFEPKRGELEAWPLTALLDLGESSLDEVSRPTSSLDEVSRPTSPLDEVSRPTSPLDEVSRPTSSLDEVSRPMSSLDEVSRPTSSLDEVSRPTSPLDEVSRPMSSLDEVSRPMSSLDEVSRPMSPEQNLAEARKRVRRWSFAHCVTPYYEELLAKRTRETAIKQRYLKQSFNIRIAAAMREIGAYKRRERAGEAMAMAIRQAQSRKDDLIARREQRLEAVEHNRYLSRRQPEVLGVAVVQPLPQTDEQGGAMHPSKEIEAAAMAVAMAYERQREWTPEDVAKENLGFDIRSHGPEGQVRRIEVKGRAGDGAVRLSPNEWLKAQQLGESFWLYIVIHCADEPRLWVMQDPAAQVQPEEEVQVTSYLVERGTWQTVAEPRDVVYEA